jgi:hypothetical protein
VSAYARFLETYRGYTAEDIDRMAIERFLTLLPSMDDAMKGAPIGDVADILKHL